MHISMPGNRFWRAKLAMAGERTSRENNLVRLSPTEHLLVQQILSARASNGNEAPSPLLRYGEWQALFQAGREHGLVPLLFDSLIRRANLDSLPPDVMESLHQSSFRTGL